MRVRISADSITLASLVSEGVEIEFRVFNKTLTQKVSHKLGQFFVTQQGVHVRPHELTAVFTDFNGPSVTCVNASVCIECEGKIVIGLLGPPLACRACGKTNE